MNCLTSSSEKEKILLSAFEMVPSNCHQGFLHNDTAQYVSEKLA